MGAARFVYNQGVAHVRAGNAASRTELRRLFAADGSPLARQHPWLLDVPYKVREQATDDLFKAQQANLARREKDPKHRRWTFQFRSRKHASAWTAGLPAQCFHRAEVLPRPETRRPRRDGEPHADARRRDWTRIKLFRNKHSELGSFWAVEALPSAVLSGKVGKHAVSRDCRLTLDPLGRFHLCVPVPAERPPVAKPEAERTVVALDPGVRSFQYYYSPEVHGGYTEGAAGFGRIFSHCQQLDETVALKAQRPTTRFLQRTYTAQCWRLRQRIRNLVDEAHKKVALDLTRRFDTVLIPDFKTKQMAQRRGREDGLPRTIRSKTARSMLTWAHYRFRTFLTHKALERGKEVVVVTEEYTSKTCGACGHMNAKFSSKVFKCAACGIEMDRDANGARNIFLKHIEVPGG
jgi:putative transposase